MNDQTSEHTRGSHRMSVSMCIGWHSGVNKSSIPTPIPQNNSLINYEFVLMYSLCCWCGDFSFPLLFIEYLRYKEMSYFLSIEFENSPSPFLTISAFSLFLYFSPSAILICISAKCDYMLRLLLQSLYFRWFLWYVLKVQCSFICVKCILNKLDEVFGAH